MKACFGYIRVSTTKQGDGVSLVEQKAAIERYAAHNDITIIEWFEERQTAAKRGRPVFDRMLALLRNGKAAGVVIHKIDRSARNLKDWADLGELIDAGVTVHFVADALDLKSRGGRLSADIQAIVAADYVRNLREETRKGFYGRLKQGLYPLPAPLGYLNTGKGRPKEIDPRRAHLVRQAFTLYASGNYSLRTLLPELRKLGLRGARGRMWSANGLAWLLSNPFYCGLIRIKRTGETFPGIHPPLVSVALYERVQHVLHGKAVRRIQQHAFTYRRLLQCARCARSLTGELQKGSVYYRCHSRSCVGTSVREDAVEEAVRDFFARVQLTEQEAAEVHEGIRRVRDDLAALDASRKTGLRLQLADAKARSERLTDALIDGVLDKASFEERRSTLLMDIARIEEELRVGRSDLDARVDEMFELAKSLYSSHELGNSDEKRRLAQITVSNFTVRGKKLEYTPLEPFALLANRHSVTCGGSHRDRVRTREICQERKRTLHAFVNMLLTAP